MVANTQRGVFVAGIKIKSGIDVRMNKDEINELQYI